MRPVLMVIGTRPEGIKMMPVYYALKKSHVPVYLCSTSQHKELLSEVFTLFDVIPDRELGIMQPGQDLFSVTTKVMQEMKIVLEEVNPSLLLVQGDTTTVMAASLSAFYKQIPVGHIEAGLRTGDIYSPFPEELNRKIVTLGAQYHFAPTAQATAQLLAEGVDRSKVFCTGNTVVDALRIIEDKITRGEVRPESTLERIIVGATIQNQKKMLFTMHRRESFGGGIERIVCMLKDFAQEHPEVCIIYPFHPNPQVQEVLKKIDLTKLENVFLIPPLAYKDLVFTLLSIDFVATDSGGIQEEAVSLGKPVIVLRDKSERMEGVWAGLATLVGTDEKKCKHALEKALIPVIKNVRSMVYGDGYAAERIVTCIQTIFANGIYAVSAMQKMQLFR